MSDPIVWALYDRGGSDDVARVVGYEAEDAGMVMLRFMKDCPVLIAKDYIDWLSCRHKTSLLAVTALFNPSDLDRLKEDYLDFVGRIAEDVGWYNILDTSLTIGRRQR